MAVAIDHNMPKLSQPSDLAHSLKQAFEVANIHRSISSPCLSLTPKSDNENFHFNPRVEIVGGHSDPKTRALVVEVAIVMASGVNPVPVSNGLSGAYFLRGWSTETIAVVKPIELEPFGFSGRVLGQPGMRRSIRVGETGVRELAAYMLDHNGFSGVPPTALVKISHIAFRPNNSEVISVPPCKIASLQRFVDHDSDAGDLGPSGFSVSSVHKIGILDVRLLNLDRHAGNMLVKKGHEYRGVGASDLVPIDHGLCLPEWLDDPYFEWLHWPQASVPFTESEVEFILDLDPFKEGELLRRELPSMRESSIRVLILCTVFLKQAAKSELCLADIGEMMTREFDGGEETISVLENICLKAKTSTSTISDDLNGKDFQHEDEVEILQFDDENEDLGICKPQNTIISSTRSLSGLLDEEKGNIFEVHYEDNFLKNNNNMDNGNEFKNAGMTRSMTFSEPNHISENGSVFLGGMSEEEWDVFLEHFEKLLPEFFDERKNMASKKQRLGTSCGF